MMNSVLHTGRRIVRLATATPRRAAGLKYILPIVLVSLVFAVLPRTPLTGPSSDFVVLTAVVICCWFSGPRPALAIPLVIWIATRLSLDEPDVNWLPSAREFVTFLAVSLLTGAIGLAGQYHRTLRNLSLRHNLRMSEYVQALSRAHIIFRNLDGRISAWNAGARQLYGWSSDEADGRLVHELLQTRADIPLDEVRAQLLATGEWQGEIRQRRKDGAELRVAVHCIRHGSDDEHPGSVVEIHNDVTELRRIEAVLRESDRRKDLFVATLAHELRNPLAPLQSGLEVLRMTAPGSTDAAPVLDIFQRQLAHIVHMVDDLLDVGRITTGKIELRRSTVLLSEIIQDAVEAVRPQIDDAQLDLQVTQADSAVMLDADADRLVQVLVNLLGNAVKFTQPGGHIWLSSRLADGDAVLTVSDDGCGIAAASLPRIFDVFAQVADPLHRNTGGLGLGLSLVKSFVEMHGGTVSAASEGPGSGASFCVRLPAMQIEQLESTPVLGIQPAATPRQLGVHRVLVVDDNEDAACTLSILLSKTGFEARPVFDGPTALNVVDEFHPHAVVLDLGMPGMDGLQLARRLRMTPATRDTLLIAVTGWDKDEDRLSTHEAGIDHHLAKPVQIDTLSRLLQSRRVPFEKCQPAPKRDVRA